MLNEVVKSATECSLTVSLVNQKDQTPKQVFSFLKVGLICFVQDDGGMFKHLITEAIESFLVMLGVELEILRLLHLLHCLCDVVQTVLQVVKIG